MTKVILNNQGDFARLLWGVSPPKTGDTIDRY